ncbi:hypothetical protein Tco_0713287 [Tanacetum coccineum]
MTAFKTRVRDSSVHVRYARESWETEARMLLERLGDGSMDCMCSCAAGLCRYVPLCFAQQSTFSSKGGRSMLTGGSALEADKRLQNQMTDVERQQDRKGPAQPELQEDRDW